MRYLTALVSCLSLIAISAGAQERIYKSKDAQGNTVFTDVPTQDSRQVEIGTTNTADAVDVPPRTERKEVAADKPAPAASPGESNPVYIGGDDNLIENAYEEKRQRELRERVGDNTDGPEKPAHVSPLPNHPTARPHPGGRR